MYFFSAPQILYTSPWSQGKGPAITQITAYQPWLHIGIT